MREGTAVRPMPCIISTQWWLYDTSSSPHELLAFVSRDIFQGPRQSRYTILLCMNNNDVELSSDVCRLADDAPKPPRASRAGDASLTPRQIKIIQLLAEGRSNKRIAQELGISVRTVEAHRAHVMQKLHLRSLVQLLYYAMEHGIVPPPDL
ncbi:MAG: response regulator transcription factor [Candidatus Acidiferrales bacterium]